MNILGKVLLDFKSEEQKQKRVEELSSTLVELSATKDYLVDTYNTLNKSIVTDNGDLENKRVEFNKGYLKQMAQFKLKERKLNEEKDYIEKSIDKTNSKEFSQRNNEEIYKSLDKIKTFYKRSKIDLNTYNDILKSITKKKTHYADICVLNEVGELLLLKRSNYDSTNAGAWVIPGGHVDPGEDCETAAKRELLEEAGISVDLLMTDDNPFKPTWSKVGEYDDENCHIDYFCLSGANMSRFEIILQEEEMRDYCWINRMDISNYPMVFNMQENIKKVLYWEDTPQTKIIKKAYDLGLVSEEVLEKSLNHKYIRREGNKGNYTYKYNEEQSKKQEYARISKQADRIIAGGSSINRLPNKAERGRIRGGKLNVEATLLLRRGKRTDEQLYDRDERLDILKEYSKENGYWVNDYESKYGVAYRISGATESEVYYGHGEDKGYVFKINNFSQHEDPLELMDRIAINNLYFPGANLELVGFTIRDGKVNAILKQPFIKMSSKPEVPLEEISKDMSKRGFEDMGGNMFKNDLYIIEDLHQKNVCYSDGGSIIYFDAVCRPNEDGEGYGGKLIIDENNRNLIRKSYKTNNMNSLSEKEVSEIRKEKVDLLIKSFEGDILSKDLLMKALKNLGHLVPKKVQIKGKDGKIHQAIRWINPDTGESDKLAEKDKTSYIGNFDEDFYSVLNSDSNKASKLRSFVNLGVLDKSILTVLTGVPYSDVNWYLTKGDIQIDLNSLKDNSEIVRDKIRSEQATLDTPEGIENAEITKESRDLDSLWEDYEKNLNRVIKRRHKFAIAYGTGGVGKTYTFDQLANKHQLREYEEEVQPDEDQYDYVVVGGKITPTQVYAELYRHRTKLIVFDDCDSFLKMEEVQGFLKKGLDTGSGCKISNKTSRKVYTIEGDPESGVIPSTFTFSGRVIAITNLTAQQIDQAVKSRGLCSNLSMTVDETIDKLGKIKDKIVLYTSDKAEVIDVSQKARDFAFEILKKNKDKLGADINTRIYSNSILMADEGIEDGLSEKRIQTEIENYFDSITGNFDESIRKFKK